MAAHTEWHDSDEFWRVCAPVLFAEERLTSTPAEVDRMLTLLQLRPDSDVLDLCCGIGRHSLELARRGHRVTGVDRTAAYLHQARERADTERLAAEFIKQDMKSFCRPEAFDGAISMFTSFGYYEDRADNQQVLANVFTSLRKGGRLMVDLHGRENLARIFRPRDWRRSGEYIVMEEREILDDWARLHNRWILLKGSRRHDFEFTLHLYSAVELKAMMLDAGFKTARAYGSLDGKPYDHEAKRLIVVATK